MSTDVRDPLLPPPDALPTEDDATPAGRLHEGALERRNHWEKTSHALLVGAILHVLHAEPNKTLAGVAAFLSDPERPIEATLRRMMTTPHRDGRPHPVIAAAAR